MKRRVLIFSWFLLALFLGLLLQQSKPRAQSGTTCSNSTTCSSSCSVPSGSGKLPDNTYTVCTDPSVTNLNNPNLQTAINNAVSGWNNANSGNANAPTFQTGTTGCLIAVSRDTGPRCISGMGLCARPEQPDNWWDRYPHPQWGILVISKPSYCHLYSRVRARIGLGPRRFGQLLTN